MWGQTRTEITWTASAQGYTNAQDITDVSFDDNVSGVFAKGTGSNAPKYYTSGTAIRCYGGNTIEISTTVGNLTGIAITFGSSDGSNTITTDVGSYENGTWSGEAESVTFTIGGTSGNRRIAGFRITYATEATTVAMPTFDPASGTEFGDEGLEVTISCETENVNIYYTTDGSTPDDESTLYTAPFTITETTTIKAIAFDGNDNTSAVATATYTYVDPNQPGTQANPYTVAQARAAIDAGTGTQGVYATGIVSSIPTAWNSQYSNITFNFVDNAGDTEFLQAYRCKSSSTANASEVQVGDVVVVYGNLKNYNGTYEFDANCQLVSLTHPSILAPAFSIAAGGYAEAQSVELSCETPDAVIYYTLDGSDPTNASTQYNGAISVTETTTIKAIAYVGTANSPVAEATYYILSSDNVYTVTEALAFTSYPQNNIFVSGIVSTAPESLISNAQLTYNISVDGQATNELEVYKGRGMNDAAFTSVDDIQVGDIVTVFGNVQEYQGTIEFGSGNYLVTFERPAAPVVPSITITETLVELDADEHEGIITVNSVNIPEGHAFFIQFLEADGETGATYDWIMADFNENNDVYFIVDANEGEERTAYLKVVAWDAETGDDPVYSDLVTINQAAPVIDYAVLPFEWEGGSSADFLALNGTSASGLGSDYAAGNAPYLIKFDGTGDYIQVKTDSRPGFVTIGVKMIGGATTSTITVQGSSNGGDFTDIQVLTISGAQNSELTLETTSVFAENDRYVRLYFTKGSNVGVGPITIAQYTEPVLVPSITVNPATVDENAEEHDGTLDLTYENMTITDMGDFDIQYYDAEGEETDEPDWIEVLVAEQDPEVGEGYVVSYYILENEGTEARTAYFKVYAMDDEGELVYSNIVTVSQDAPVVPPTPGNWVLTDLTDLTENDVFVIVGDNGDTYAMSNDKGTSAAPAAVAVTVVEGTLSAEPAANLQWNISITEDGYTFYPNGETETWLYCTNTNNGVRVGTNEENNVFTMSENGYLHNTATGRYIGIYNSQDWRCYTSEGGNIADQTFAFYKKVAAATETYPLDIIGYEAGSDGGYYLIASPVTLNPADVEGMTTGNFDLYYFDQTEEQEWRNYVVNPFNLVPGKGYLYAKQATTEGEVFHFELTGTPYNNQPITLSKTEGGDFPGWNLVGNPFGETAYIDRDCYVMKADGSEIITGEGNEIAVMQGFFVIADHDGEELVISTEAPANTDGKIVMNVSNGRRSVIDRAMVRFGEGRTLPKFMLNDGNTKIYIAEGNEEYAVVRSINESTTPVSFHAAENGTYTLSITAEDVDFTFFHLIDNLTGNDINLLSTPSYTFEASTTDYAQRFSLLYATVDGVGENNGEAFAFFNGNEWVVNNEGEANLQVIDVTGRLISSETVYGTATVSLNQPAGIYMLRLVNGENVKVQKVVVR